MGLKYKYTPRFGPVGVEYDPLVDVVYTNPKNGKSVEVRSLIDSGAAGIILHGQFAELLGQRGFFDNYKVTFERYIQRIELTPRLPAKP